MNSSAKNKCPRLWGPRWGQGRQGCSPHPRFVLKMVAAMVTVKYQGLAPSRPGPGKGGGSGPHPPDGKPEQPQWFRHGLRERTEQGRNGRSRRGTAAPALGSRGASLTTASSRSLAVPEGVLRTPRRLRN